MQESYQISLIMNTLGHHWSTIYRELNRCSNQCNVATASQANANQHTTHEGRKAKHKAKLIEDI